MIANILRDDNGGYTKLTQIVKQNVKAALSENKKLISVFFTGITQTIKSDPQMVILIQNIPISNDGEQHKDANNNITKHLESNKDNIYTFNRKALRKPRRGTDK